MSPEPRYESSPFAGARIAGVVVAAAVAMACGSERLSPATDAGLNDALQGHTARGRVVDLSGAPVVDIYVTVSTEFCVPDRTSATGTFIVKNILPSSSKRLILYGPTAKDGPYASLSFAFTDGDADVELPAIVTPKLETPLAYRADLTDPQRLTTSDGFAMTVRAADLHVEGFDDTKLFAVPIPIAKAPPFAVASKLHALYVLEPLQSTLAKPAPVEFPNPNGLAAGSKVDVFQLDYWKGELVRRAGGHVRDDGKVVTDDGEGITELTWIGFAPSGA